MSIEFMQALCEEGARWGGAAGTETRERGALFTQYGAPSFSEAVHERSTDPTGCEPPVLSEAVSG